MCIRILFAFAFCSMAKKRKPVSAHVLFVQSLVVMCCQNVTHSCVRFYEWFRTRTLIISNLTESFCCHKLVLKLCHFLNACVFFQISCALKVSRQKNYLCKIVRYASTWWKFEFSSRSLSIVFFKTICYTHAQKIDVKYLFQNVLLHNLSRVFDSGSNCNCFLFAMDKGIVFSTNEIVSSVCSHLCLVISLSI